MARFIVTLKRTFMWEGEAKDDWEAEMKAIEGTDHPCYVMGEPDIVDIEEVTSDSTAFRDRSILFPLK